MIGFRGKVTSSAENVVANIRLACHAIPALKRARLTRSWTGFEAETADALPAAGAIPGLSRGLCMWQRSLGLYQRSLHRQTAGGAHLGREPEMPLFPIDRLLASAPETKREDGVT